MLVFNKIFLWGLLWFIFTCSGSRVDKHWFIVRDSSVKTERLLTLVPKSANCPIQCDSDTRQIILDLFLALHHPYIYPVLDLEFREGAQNSQTFIVLVLPFNSKGSLKDLIYKVRNILGCKSELLLATTTAWLAWKACACYHHKFVRRFGKLVHIFVE